MALHLLPLLLPHPPSAPWLFAGLAEFGNGLVLSMGTRHPSHTLSQGSRTATDGQMDVLAVWQD